MSSAAGQPGWPVLERFQKQTNPPFSIPAKKINDGDDLNFFLSSTAYRDILLWIHQLNRSMFPRNERGGNIEESKLSPTPFLSDSVRGLQNLVNSLKGLISQAPPETAPRRFGNIAFRKWYKLAEENADQLLDTYIGKILDEWSAGERETRDALRNEVRVYLLGSFGSAQRLDYGTGHELSFLAFLACLWKLCGFEDGEERSIVVAVVNAYIELVRALILTYTLEPAGSHGVWGLDDHSFAPYIFGSAQLSPPINIETPGPVPTEGSLITAPSPKSIVDRPVVAEQASQNMYFSAIQFIYDVKRGPFWEHSPVLFDVSGIRDGWGKINKGMLKMYAAEVLGKFPVVQHFPFGSFFSWERDPAFTASSQHSRVHASQQPKSMDVPPPPRSGRMPAAGTAAPWATGASTKMPSRPPVAARANGATSASSSATGLRAARGPPR